MKRALTLTERGQKGGKSALGSFGSDYPIMSSYQILKRYLTQAFTAPRPARRGQEVP